MLQQVCPASCVPCHASTLKKDGGEHGGQGSDTRNMKRHTYKNIHMKKDIKIQSKLEGSKQGKCGNKEATTKKTNQTKKHRSGM